METQTNFGQLNKFKKSTLLVGKKLKTEGAFIETIYSFETYSNKEKWKD